MKLVKFTLLYSILIFGLLGCSQSGRRSPKSDEIKTTTKQELPHSSEAANVVKMERQNGVFQIPVEVNGAKMYFIFDTGASVISISEVEALFLVKQGSLSREDILGSVNFSDANGDISEGTIIRLRTVKIGNRILENIEASVVHNLKAPLLFGQSALEKFGKISIDHNKGEITFE